ncbi:Rp1-like protein [Rhynchospora pubera]|uniref:Rp1-like protein n=1 Tax=Rhynchospora pubera TaxID=906938 RepID=A0AAV8HFY1_9POAL|nr:Rp1-like protein [Rhynchospora pubera]
MEYNNYVEIPRDTRNKLSGKENIHNLSLQASMISELKDDICKQKELRTLIIFDGDGTVSKKDLKEIIQTSEKLRVLSLPSCGIKDLPDSIGSLKHLRYIDISGCSLRKLPNSICKLYHLQVFALSSCESLPENFSQLISLRHFLTNDETVSKIREVVRLTSIQGLTEFHVEHGNSCNLEQLKNLAELRGQLRIKGLQKVTRKDDAVKAKITEKVNLESLALEWDRNERDNDDAEILESLCPNPLIRELHIINFPGKKLPNWLLSQNSGKYLRALSLKGCAKVPNLPSFDQCFPNCIFLALGELDLVKELPPLPPKLMFSYIELPLLVSFVTTDDFQMAEERKEFISMVVKQMANYCKLRDVFVPINLLSTLSSSLPPISKRLGGETNISTSSTKCKKFLSKLDRVGDPENIPTDELMDMWVTGMDCQLEMIITNQALSVSFQNLYSLSSLCLSNILTITSLPPEEVLCELKHLQSIDITDCYLLTSFGGISALTSLKKLKLQGSCLEWKAPSDGSVLPSELEELEFWNCANIDVIIERSKLAKLHTLKFFYCSIKKINLITLSSLAELEIVLCSQPFVLEGLSSVHALHGLRVTKCPMISLSSPDDKLSSQITFTEIDDLSLLRLIMSDETVSKLEGLVIRSFEGGFINDEPFEYLASLNFLIIDDCQITSMPTKLKGLTNLYSLSLRNCKKLHDLTVLPEDLPELVIKDCPILEKRYGSAGPKHKHIAHIPRILFQW